MRHQLSLLPENEGSRLERLRSFRILGTPREQVFDDIARLAAVICDAPVAVITFIDEERVWFKANSALSWMRSREMARSVPMQSYNPMS